MLAQAGLYTRQCIVDGLNMQFPIHDTQHHGITVCQPKRTADVGRNLQPSTTYQLTPLYIHVPSFTTYR